MPRFTSLGQLALAALLAGPGSARAYGTLVGGDRQALTLTSARVVLADHGDGSVSAAVEIGYEGTAERFGWILPVSGTPQVRIASTAALDRLQGLTDPVYSIEAVAHGTCQTPQAIASAWPPVDPTRRALATFDEGPDGPFAHRLEGGDPREPDPAGALLEWLEAGGVTTSGVDRTLLQRYLNEGHNLLGLRLGKDHRVGSIRPVLLTYEAGALEVPLRAAARAAGDDVPLLVWVLGPQRAVPLEYASIELNQARLDWFDPVASYHRLVSEATDEAGGRGFVTEFAGGTGALASGFSLLQREQWDAFVAGGLSEAPDLLDSTALVFDGWDGFEAAVRANASGAEELSREELLACISCVVDDVEGFVASLDALVVEPLLAVHDLLRTTNTATRLYTRLGGEEMTRDPAFAFDATGGAVLGRRTAIGSLSCDDRFAVELPQGHLVRGSWGRWPENDGLPAARRILQHAEGGEAEVVVDNRERIEEAFPRPQGDAAEPADAGTEAGADGGRPAAGLGDRGSGLCVAARPGSDDPATPLGLLCPALPWIASRRPRGLGRS